jgi:hypothetical protein
MGQAKRKRLFARAGLCICPSNRPAGECCFNGKFWHKPPTALKLQGGSGAAHEFHGDVNIGAMLQDPLTWPPTTGLYFTLQKGDRFMRVDHFQFQPLFDGARKIAGVLLSIQGITFSLFAAPVRGAMVHQSSYRPGQIQMRTGAFLNTIELSWSDGRKHGPVGMELVAKPGQYDPATARRGLTVGPPKPSQGASNRQP